MRQQNPTFLAHFGNKRLGRRFAPNKNERDLQPLRYDALMLNTSFATAYRKLRKMAGLAQAQAVELLPSRRQLQRAETRSVRLDPDTEAELVQLARCSDEHPHCIASTRRES